MPLLAKKIFNCAKPISDAKPGEQLFTISHTKEQFRSKDEYEKRLHLYKSRVWTCQSTGHVNLTHEEAWNSEKTVIKTLKEQFPPCYDKPVLELVHHSTQSLDSLVDQAWLMLQQTLVIGERVLLKVKAGGKAMKAVVVKTDKAGCDRNPTSNCSSPSSDKENTDKEDNTSPGKKWVPPKLLPYKYSIRFENEDSVIHSVPAADLSRGDKPPSKELLRLFIRTYALRAGQSGSCPWIVDDNQVKKLELSSKFAGFLLSPVKWKPDEMAKKLNEEVGKYKSPSKGSQRIKHKMDAKEEKKKEKAKKSLSKLQEKGERAKAAKEAAAKKTEIVTLDSSDDDGAEKADKKESPTVMEISDSDSDSDTPLALMKSQITPKKKSAQDTNSSKDKNKLKKSQSSSQPDKKKSPSLADMKKKLGKKKPMSLADLKEQLNKKKSKKTGESKKKEKSEKGDKKKSKKGQDPRQLTLFDLSKKKGLNTPEKKSKSPQKSPSKQLKTPDKKPKIMSPPRTPAVVKKIQKAMKDKNLSMIGTYTVQAAKTLSSAQRAKLPDGIKEMVQKKFDSIQEKIKLSRMSESEKKEYLLQQAAKKRKEKLKILRKRTEDTLLDLKPLPPPKLILTPDGLPNEAFGDVTMITEFISCYAGLLMPEDEYPIYTDALMKALTTGKEGFAYISRVLAVLLQTLLQDQIAEDYQEIKVPLNDIPVNPCTTSELVRLCLRKQDVTDDKSDSSNLTDEDEDSDEVPDDLIQLLETQEFFQLDPLQKLQILKGLCLRIMGTYSVQDYMEQKQQESSRLWKEKLAQLKDKRIAKKEEKLQKGEKESSKDKQAKSIDNDQNKEKNILLTHFYGKKNSEEIPSSGNNSNSEATEGDEDGDLASVVKRRRMTAAKAMEERRKKEIEDKERREKEMELYKEQKERELFEKQFTEGIYLAKVTQRQMPIGTDRNHCRYWIFSDVTPGLFVEKGWVGDEIEYTCCKDMGDGDDESSSSSESEEEEEEGSNNNPKKKKIEKCLDKTFPHIGQNLWFTYGNVKEVDELLECLNSNGSRESVLKKELQKRYPDINKAIYKSERANKELRKSDGEVEMITAFKEELLDTEMKLRNGGLGGVDDFTTWNTRLETSEDIPALAECLLETQAAVLERFRDGIMVVKKRKKIPSDDVKEEPEAGEEEEEIKEIAPGIQQWRDGVKNSGTLSRLHVFLGILDSCIKWEKSAENAKCKICRKKGDEDRLLLCDDCNQAFHMYCLRPSLLELPEDDWHCPACAPQYRKRIRDVPGRYKEIQENGAAEDSDEDDNIKEAKTKSIKHDTHCVECGADENLIECAECPSVYHLECHEPPLRHPPRGRWVCNYCKNGLTTRQRKGRSARSVRGAGRKRKRYVESEEEDEESEESEEEEEDSETEDVPQKKAAKRSSSGGGKRGQKTKSSPKTGAGRSRGKRSLPSPEVMYEPKPKVSRRAPSELSVMEDIVNQMLEFKDAWPFYLNVNKKDVPDYYEIIKQPISFQKIKDRLNCLVYGSPKEVIADISLLFRNGVEYNKEGSEVYNCLESSERHFTILLKDNLPQYSYSRDKLTNGYSDHMYSDDGRKARRSK